MSFNKVIMIGNITAEPELKATPQGTSVCTFSLAVNKKGKDGTIQASFFNVVAWRGTAEFICKYFGKGSPILVSGHLDSRSYTDAKGEKRYITEIIAEEVTFAGTKKGESAEKSVGSDDPNAYPKSLIQKQLDAMEEFDDDTPIPF